MNLSDDFLLMQAAILVATALVLSWYAWKTHEFRRDLARRQQLLADQVSTMRQSLQAELARDHATSKPLFRWRGGRASAEEIKDYFVVTCEFQNEGGPVTNLEVKPLTDDEVELVVTPHEKLGEMQRGLIRLATPGRKLTADIQFEMHYTTRFHRREKKFFCLARTSVTPSEVQAEIAELNCWTPLKLSGEFA